MATISIQEYDSARANFGASPYFKEHSANCINFHNFIETHFPDDRDRSPGENYYTFSAKKAAFIKAVASPHHNALLKVWMIKNANNKE